MDLKQLKTLILEDAAFYDGQINELKLNLFAEQLSSENILSVQSAMRAFRAQPGRRQMPMPADLVEWISENSGGHPGVEQAWALAPKDEATSTVITDEIASAWREVEDTHNEDHVAGRMAFKEIYSKLITNARANKTPVHWFASLGHDKSGREAALRVAVEKNRLSLAQATSVMPELEFKKTVPQIEARKQNEVRQLVSGLFQPMPK